MLIGSAAGSTGRIDPKTSQYSGKACVTVPLPMTSGVAAFNVADVIVAPDVASSIADAGTAHPASDVHGAVGRSIGRAGVSRSARRRCR